MDNITLNNSEQQNLLSMIRELCEVDNLELNDETILRALPGIDSLKMLELLAKIEIEFFVNLGFESIEQVETVADLYTIVARAQEEKR